MEKKLFNLSRVKDIFEVGKITVFMSVFLSCLILLTTFAPKIDAAVHYPPGSLLQPGDVTSTHIRNDEIVDEDIKTTAAIAWSKIDKTGSSIADLATAAFSDTTGTVGVTRGGTGLTSCTAGDLITATGANTFSNLAKGTANQVLGMNNGATTQEYKTLTAGTGIAITHGANSVTIAASSISTLNKSLTAGEALTAGNAVYMSDGTGKIASVTIPEGDAVNNGLSGGTGNSQELGQSFVATETTTIKKIRIRATKQGTPTDNLVVGIQADSSGHPDGSYIGSGTLAGGDITGEAYYNITLSAAVTGSSTYWVVFSRSGARDTSNYPMIITSETASTYASGVFSVNNSGTWANAATRDAKLILYKATTAGKVYKTAAGSAEEVNGYIGFAAANISADADGLISIGGEATGLSGLTAGKQYYLSDTIGTLSLTAGTVSRKACIALSATTCTITNVW